MIVDRFSPHRFHQSIESEGGGAFEESISLAFTSYTINNIIAFHIAFHHLGDDIDVILQVGINGNSCIATFLYSIQSGHKCVLMPHISSQVQPAGIRCIFIELLDDFPGTVCTPIVYVQYIAFGRYTLFSCQPIEQLAEPFMCFV